MRCPNCTHAQLVSVGVVYCLAKIPPRPVVLASYCLNVCQRREPMSIVSGDTYETEPVALRKMIEPGRIILCTCGSRRPSGWTDEDMELARRRGTFITDRFLSVDLELYCAIAESRA